MSILGIRGRIAYAQLAFPLAFAGLPLYIQAPDFYATQYGISLGFLGGALLGVRLCDALLDPFIGKFSDRFPQWRSRVIAAAALLFALSFGALYHPPAMLEMFWFVSCVFAATLSFSALLINLNALGALIDSHGAEKTSLSAWREGFGLAGLLCAISLPAVMGDMSDYALTGAAMMILSASILLLWLRSSQAVVVPVQAPLAGGILAAARAPFAGFFACYGVSMLASSLPAVLFPFFVRDRLGAGGDTGYFLLLYFAAGILAIPLWRRLATAFGNENIWVAAMAMSAFSISLAVFVDAGDLNLFAAICLLSGAAFGAEVFLPPAILASRISDAGMDSHASFFFGVHAFFMKLSLAVATVLAFTALDAAGFTPAAANDSTALSALAGLYALLPAVIKLFSAIVFFKWRTHEKNIRNHLRIGGHHVS